MLQHGHIHITPDGTGATVSLSLLISNTSTALGVVIMSFRQPFPWSLHQVLTQDGATLLKWSFVAEQVSVGFTAREQRSLCPLGLCPHLPEPEEQGNLVWRQVLWTIGSNP